MISCAKVEFSYPTYSVEGIALPGCWLSLVVLVPGPWFSLCMCTIPLPSFSETSMAFQGQLCHCLSRRSPLLACEFNPSCRRHFKCFIQPRGRYPYCGRLKPSLVFFTTHALHGALCKVSGNSCWRTDWMAGHIRAQASSSEPWPALGVTSVPCQGSCPKHSRLWLEGGQQEFNWRL